MTTVVVGAGLAGLACARRLHGAGEDVVVLEAGDGVGGRVRTDAVDGMLLDRGFQVLLTGYPATRAQLDYDALHLRPFAPAVRIRTGGRFADLADPLRDPITGLRGAVSPVLTPLDGLRLLKLRYDVGSADGQQLATRAQVTTAQRLADLGFSERIVDRFFRPFFAGVFFDDELTTSSRMFDLVMRSFFAGDVAVPAHGMQAMPEQLAARLPTGTVRLDTPVTTVDVRARSVTTAGGETVGGDAVVVATDGPTAEQLLGGGAVASPPARGTVTLYYAATHSPVDGPVLVLDADRDGPVNNVAVMSEVSEFYAPPGVALVSVSVVGVPDDDDRALDAACRRQLRDWFGTSVDRWELVRAYRIPWAQPRQDLVDLPSLRRDVRVADGVFVCGDHRDTASLQGALVSGRRTAEAVLA